MLELVGRSAHADEVRSYLSESVGGLRHLELTILEGEIISRLMQGRRTRNELVEEIYQTRKGEPDYVASYTKVRRALEGLQSKGYVSTPPFAKEKPYKITSYAMQKVASVSPDIKQPRLVERIDPILYAACLITGFVTLHVAGSFVDPPRVLAALPASFFVLLGFSLDRIWNTLRKVI